MKTRKAHDYGQILSGLPVFEAAARNGNFSRAASELGITPGAVSRRVQAIEDVLGTALFVRRGRTVSLTADGTRLAEMSRLALDMTETMLDELGGQLSGSLRIGTLPSLGSQWLAPRIGEFVALHPNVKVSVGTFDVDFSSALKDPVTWDPSDFDLVITWGNGGWRKLQFRKLADEQLLPVCSPAFLNAHPVSSAGDLFGVPRLGHKTRPDTWKTYCEFKGLPITQNLGQPGLEFDHFFMLIQAAYSGAGVALLPSIVVAQDLAEGKLVQCAEGCQSGSFYATVASASALERPIVSAFLRWLTDGSHL